jgi:hypothetical protein
LSQVNRRSTRLVLNHTVAAPDSRRFLTLQQVADELATS